MNRLRATKRPRTRKGQNQPNPMTATQIHQINETHLGSSATPEQAQALAAELTRRGWPAEYCPEQGVPSYLRDEQTGDQIDIPDAVWSDAMASVA